MTGFTYMDTVTGAVTYYTSSGGEFNSTGAEAAVASNPIVRQGKLFPTQPLLYDVFNQNTWVVPLVAETGKYQTVSLVQAKNGHVIVGSSSSPKPQDDAFAQYATFLGVAGAPQAPVLSASLTSGGTIDRIAAGPDGTVYFTLRGSPQMYALDSHDDPSALLVRPGDAVRLHASAPSGDFARVDALQDAALARSSN
jgi:hypothetical protein